MKNDPDESDLAAHLEKILSQIQLESPQHRQAIRSILYRSVEYGRAGRVIGDNPADEDYHEYVDHVILYYKKYQLLVTCLERREQEAWTIMARKIHTWANRYLIKHYIYGPLREEILKVCVPNSVLAYLSSTYHYDSDFYAWFCVLVQNVCRKYIREQHRPNNIVHEKALAQEDFEQLLEALPDKNEKDSQRLRETRSLLLEAIEKLSSEARKQIIMLYYFSGFTFKEIAVKMNRTMTAIYKLHFDALKELRDIFDNDD